MNIQRFATFKAKNFSHVEFGKRDASLGGEIVCKSFKYNQDSGSVSASLRPSMAE